MAIRLSALRYNIPVISHAWLPNAADN